MILSSQQIAAFIGDGFIRIDNAFSAEMAAEARELLWRDLPVRRDNPASWTEPVIRLGMYTQQPFRDSANTPVLQACFDELAGPGQWVPRQSMGTFPVRFPSEIRPADDGWHVDAAFPGHDPADYMQWRVNIHSRGRALLMLFLYSDVSPDDAPTRILKSSHLDVARLLSGAGEEGLAFMELAGKLDTLPQREEVLATGPAGTVYLCHPFLVHAAQQHRGIVPRFMAQPALELRSPLVLEGQQNYAPIAIAIREALGMS